MFCQEWADERELRGDVGFIYPVPTRDMVPFQDAEGDLSDAETNIALGAIPYGEAYAGAGQGDGGIHLEEAGVYYTEEGGDYYPEQMVADSEPEYEAEEDADPVAVLPTPPTSPHPIASPLATAPSLEVDDRDDYPEEDYHEYPEEEYPEEDSSLVSNTGSGSGSGVASASASASTSASTSGKCPRDPSPEADEYDEDDDNALPSSWRAIKRRLRLAHLSACR